MANTGILTVKTENFEMNYIKFGKGERTAVILPGMSLQKVLLSADAVVTGYKCFSDDYTVYLFERKENIEDGYSVFDMATDTAEAMKILGLFDVYAMGFSQGGMILQVIAANYPELIKKAVLGSTLPRQNEVSKETFETWISLAKTNDVKKINRDTFERIYTKALIEKMGGLSVFENMGEKEDCERFLYLAKACLGFDFYENIKKISCPVLVLGAEDDRVLSKKGSVEIAEKLGCEIYIYENYSHAVYDEAPDYKERIMKFFGK